MVSDPGLAEAMAYLAEHLRHRPQAGLSWRALINDRPWADRYFELSNDILTARMNTQTQGASSPAETNTRVPRHRVPPSQLRYWPAGYPSRAAARLG